MAALYRWFVGFLPALMLMAFNAWRGFMALKIGYRLMLIGIVGALLPLPDFVEEFPARLAALPGSLWFFADLIELRFGVSVIIAAYTFRWVWGVVMR